MIILTDDIIDPLESDDNGIALLPPWRVLPYGLDYRCRLSQKHIKTDENGVKYLVPSYRRNGKGYFIFEPQRYYDGHWTDPIVLTEETLESLYAIYGPQAPGVEPFPDGFMPL